MNHLECFHGDRSVAMYDLRHKDTTGTPAEGDVAFYIEQARETGGPVLELGVGTGRVALEIAKAGFEIVGLDLSEKMLARAREKVASTPPEIRHRVRLHYGDMTNFRLDHDFALVIVPFRAFHHILTAAEQKSCLRCVREHLRAGGCFVLNLFDPRLDLCLPGSHAPTERGDIPLPDGNTERLTIENRRNDPFNQAMAEEWHYQTLTPDGRVLSETTEVLRLRWTYRFEMEHLFELEGFEIEALYSDFKKSPPAYGKEQLWVARRK